MNFDDRYDDFLHYYERRLYDAMQHFVEEQNRESDPVRYKITSEWSDTLDFIKRLPTKKKKSKRKKK